MNNRSHTMTDRDLSPEPTKPDRLVRRPEARKLLGGISPQKLESMIKQGLLPEPICMGPRSYCFFESELQAFLDQVARDRKLPQGNRP